MKLGGVVFTALALGLGIALASCNGEAPKSIYFADIKLDQDSTYVEDEEELASAEREISAVVYFDAEGETPARRVDLLSEESDSIIPLIPLIPLCPPDDGYTSFVFVEAIGVNEQWSTIPDPYEWACDEERPANPCGW